MQVKFKHDGHKEKIWKDQKNFKLYFKYVFCYYTHEDVYYKKFLNVMRFPMTVGILPPLYTY